MILFQRKRSIGGPAKKDSTQSSSIRNSRYPSSSSQDVQDEKKEDSSGSGHEEEEHSPGQRVEAPGLSMTEAAAASAMATSALEEAPTTTNRAAASRPVDLDDTILDDSFSDGDGGPVVSIMKESVQELLGLGTDADADADAGAAISSLQNGDEGYDQGCLLFEDNDDQSHDVVELPAEELSTPLLPPVLRVAPSAADNNTSLHAYISKGDVADNESGQRSRSGAGPPCEINIDLDAVPPSPMRDPSLAFLHSGPPGLPQHPQEHLLNQYGNSTDSPPAEVEVNFGVANQGIRTKLCDAERLVKIILGKTGQNDFSSSPNSKKMFSTLEHGSILQAIRAFAVMKQELIELRRRQEQSDGDPPAILMNLTSPATTGNASSFSSPAKTSSNPSDRPSSSSLSPDSHSRGSRSASKQRQNLRTTRNALVMAAKKCQFLEEQLKVANETIDRFQLELRPQTNTIQALEKRLNALEVENRSLQSAQAPSDRSNPETATKSVAELEDILAKLHCVRAASVSPDERQTIRQYVRDMLERTTNENQRWALAESQQRLAETSRQLRAAHERIESLQNNNPTTGRTNEDGVPNPLQEAHRLLEAKDRRIAQLEETQVRLQSLVQLAVSKSQPLQEAKMQQQQQQQQNRPPQPLSAKERLRLLEAEHQALADSVRLLEGQAIPL